MIVIGIDPGIKGALAVMEKGRITSVQSLPTIATGVGSRREIDLPQLAHALDALGKHEPVRVYIEQVGAMPGQGVASMFSFGRSYGGILGVLAGLFMSTTRVTPQQWKREFSVGADKEQVRRRASELLPDCAHYWPAKAHDGRAEAALIALYGYRKPQI